jgi:uncharacterized protein (TIGR00297 family)
LPFLPALLLSVAIAAAGWRLRSLTIPGAVSATAVGALILCGTGWPGALALGAFFVGASGVSRLTPRPAAAIDTKGDQRDSAQVLANGAAAALGALVPGAGLWIVTTSLAAAAADTWATSVGDWSRTPPRDIVSFRRVPPGTNGAVSLVGTLGAGIGAATVGLAAAVGARSAALFPLAVGVGMLGMLMDSVLGATLQGRFHCDVCDLPTERRVHRCGQPSRRTGGLPWLTNDAVNALATLGSALAGFAVWRWSGG